VIALGVLLWRLSDRRRHGSSESPDWTLLVARNAIAHIVRRRSWRRAMRSR
jgi:hypothetical protein